jgi:hypothetical protein
VKGVLIFFTDEQVFPRFRQDQGKGALIGGQGQGGRDATGC